MNDFFTRSYWRKTAIDFFKFGVIGFLGFFVDLAMLYFGKSALGMSSAWAGIFSFPFAVTATWIGNRLYTFRAAPSMPAARQWAKFTAVCAVGFVLNRGTYLALVFSAPFIDQHPFIGVVAGTAAGMFFNFFTARRHVFGG